MTIFVLMATPLTPARLNEIRDWLGLSQEQMARLIGVSFASVNRWEGGHSAPTGPTRDMYLALDAAKRRRQSPRKILVSEEGGRGSLMYTVFQLAYGKRR